MSARVKTQTHQNNSVCRAFQRVDSVHVKGRPRQRVVATGALSMPWRRAA